MVRDNRVERHAFVFEPVCYEKLVSANIDARECCVYLGIFRTVDDAHVAVRIPQPLMVEVRLLPVGQCIEFLLAPHEFCVKGLAAARIEGNAEFYCRFVKLANCH